MLETRTECKAAGMSSVPLLHITFYRWVSAGELSSSCCAGALCQAGRKSLCSETWAERNCALDSQRSVSRKEEKQALVEAVTSLQVVIPLQG